jgi:hypothetical protein
MGARCHERNGLQFSAAAPASMPHCTALAQSTGCAGETPGGNWKKPSCPMRLGPDSQRCLQLPRAAPLPATGARDLLERATPSKAKEILLGKNTQVRLPRACMYGPTPCIPACDPTACPPGPACLDTVMPAQATTAPACSLPEHSCHANHLALACMPPNASMCTYGTSAFQEFGSF